jgi:hypothetical protein
MQGERYAAHIAGAALAALAAMCGGAFAQSAPNVDIYFSQQPLATASPFAEPSRDYTGVPAGAWMLYPTLLTGVVFDDNVYQTSSPRPAAGWRLNPGLIAIDDDGIHKTAVYGTFNAQLYPSAPDANVINGDIGFVNVWEAERDLTFRVQGDYTRLTDIYSNGVILTPSGPASIISPQEENQFTGSASVSKALGRFFASLGFQAQALTYDNVADSVGQSFSQRYRDGQIYTLAGRAGYWIGPAVYAFAETSGDWRHYTASDYDSDGYRAVAGLGTDRISLLRGEIYAGYQQQDYSDPRFGTVTDPVVGGKIAWYPTRALTLTGTLDESIGDSTVYTPSNPIGSSTEATTSTLKADYEISQQWSASGQVGWSHIDYVHSPRVDDVVITDLRVNYKVFRNFGVALDYGFTRVDSNAVGASFTRDVVTLGATYKY